MADTKPVSAPAAGPVKTAKHRSPNYPVMNLARAMEKAALFHEKYKRHYVPLSAAMEAMKYKPGSSTGLQAIATLGYFGLADSTGSGDKRQVRVSDRAAKIIGRHADGPNLLREAALMPPIHQEVYNKFHTSEGIAPDAAIRQYLVFDREDAKFSDDSATAFIDEFNQSMEFAGLGESATMSDEPTDEAETMDDGAAKPKGPPPPGTREFALPLIDGVATLRVPHPMGEANFNLLKAMLEAAKAAMVGTKPHDQNKPDA